MRLGRYKVFYKDRLISKCWTMNKCMELIANMVTIGYDRDLFNIEYIDASFDF